MRAVAAIAAKDLRLLARDRVALFWVLVFPVLFALFLGTVLEASLDRDRRPLVIAFVDEANSDASRALERALQAAPALALKTQRLDAAQHAVRRGELPAYVHVRHGFRPSTPEGIELGLDPSQQQVTAMVRTGVEAALSGLSAQAAPRSQLTLRSMLPEVARPRSAFDIVFPAAVLWGLMGCAASFAIAMVGERVGGTLDRLRVAPISQAELLAGKALACFMACLVDGALLLLIARYGFGVVAEQPLALCLVLPCVAICFVGLMLLLGQFGRSVESVAGAGWSTLIVLAMLGGAMVPLSAMPEWMRSLSNASPVKWGIFALEGAIWRDLPARELGFACALLLLAGGGTFLVAWRRSSLRNA